MARPLAVGRRLERGRQAVQMEAAIAVVAEEEHVLQPVRVEPATMRLATERSTNCATHVVVARAANRARLALDALPAVLCRRDEHVRREVEARRVACTNETLA